MPKTIYKIDKFHGGINNSADARDISDMELAECVGLDIDDIGRIKAAPRFELFTIGAEAIEEGNYDRAHAYHMAIIELAFVTSETLAL